jgi:hypothetical protein
MSPANFPVAAPAAGRNKVQQPMPGANCHDSRRPPPSQDFAGLLIADERSAARPRARSLRHLSVIEVKAACATHKVGPLPPS